MPTKRKRHPTPPFFVTLVRLPKSRKGVVYRRVTAETVRPDGTEYSLHSTKGYRKKVKATYQE